MNARAVLAGCGLVTLAVLWFLLGSVASEPERPPTPISFISPRIPIQHAPAEVPVQLRVPRHAENRWLVVAWDGAPCDETLSAIDTCDESGPCEAGSFILEIQGDHEAAILPDGPRWIKIYTRCTYLFVAELYGIGGVVRGRATVRLMVR